MLSREANTLCRMVWGRVGRPGLGRLNLFASRVHSSRSTLSGARHGRGALTEVFLPLATFKPFLSCFSSKETFAARQAW